MSGHSNPEIQKHVDSTADLVKQMNDLKNSLTENLLNQFHKDMGVPLPNVSEADVRILDYSLVYSTDPRVDEYVTGAKNILDAALAGDYPAIANKALNLVSTVATGVVGSGSVGIGLKSDSAKFFDRETKKIFISACYSLIEECSAKEWATEQNFYIAHYIFVVWEPQEHVVSAVTAARTLEA
jgi:hypothetical protein